MNDELERMGKKVAVTYYKFPTQPGHVGFVMG
jgi:hypothetical protein